MGATEILVAAEMGKLLLSLGLEYMRQGNMTADQITEAFIKASAQLDENDPAKLPK